MSLSQIQSSILNNQSADRNNFTQFMSKQNWSGYDNRTKQSENQLKTLTSFSSTLSEYLIHREQRRIKKETDEATALRREQEIRNGEKAREVQPEIKEKENYQRTNDPWSKENINKKFGPGQLIASSKVPEGVNLFGIPLEEEQNFNQGVDELKKNKEVIDEAALNVQEQGGTFQDAEKIRALSGWGLYAYTVENARIASENYKSYLEAAMKNDNETQLEYIDTATNQKFTFTPATADTLEQKQAAMSVLRQRYMKENDLLGMNRVLLSQTFYKPAIETHSNLMSGYRKREAIEKSFRIVEQAANTFAIDNDFKALIDTLAPTIDSEGNLRRRLGALNTAFDIIKGNMDIGLMDANKYTNLKNQKIIIKDNDGRRRQVTVGVHWKNRFLKLDEEFAKAQSENLDIQALEFSNASKELELEFRRENLGKRLTDAELIPWHQRWTSVTGMTGTPPWLSDYQTVEDYDAEIELENARTKRKYKGYLSESDLRNISAANYATVEGWVEKDKDKAGIAKKHQKEFKQNLEGWLDWSLKLSGPDERSSKPEFNRMYFNAMDFYNGRLDYYLNTKLLPPDEAHEMSVVDVQKELKVFDKDGNLMRGKRYLHKQSQFYSTPRYQVPDLTESERYFPIIKDGATELANYNTKKQKLNYLSNNLLPGIGDGTDGGVLSEAIRAAETRRYEDIPHVFKAIARLTGGQLDAWDIQNAQLQAAAKKKLTEKDLSQKEKPPAYIILESDNENNSGLNGNLNHNPNTVKLDAAKYNLIDYNQIVNRDILDYTGNFSSVWLTDNNLMFPGIIPPKVEEGDIDFDRLGLAFNVLADKGKSKIGGKVEDWKEHWNTVGTNIVNTFKLKEIGDYLAPPPELSANPNVRSGARTPQTGFSHVEVQGSDPETDLGKKTGETIVNMFTNMRNWSVDELNNFADRIITDVPTREVERVNSSGRRVEKVTEYLVNDVWTTTPPGDSSLINYFKNSENIDSQEKSEFFINLYELSRNPIFLDYAVEFSY